MPDQFNLCVIRSKSAFLRYILIAYLAYTIDCVAAQKLHVLCSHDPFWTVKNMLYMEINAVI